MTDHAPIDSYGINRNISVPMLSPIPASPSDSFDCRPVTTQENGCVLLDMECALCASREYLA